MEPGTAMEFCFILMGFALRGNSRMECAMGLEFSNLIIQKFIMGIGLQTKWKGKAKLETVQSSIRKNPLILSKILLGNGYLIVDSSRIAGLKGQELCIFRGERNSWESLWGELPAGMEQYTGRMGRWNKESGKIIFYLRKVTEKSEQFSYIFF